MTSLSLGVLPDIPRTPPARRRLHEQHDDAQHRSGLEQHLDSIHVALDRDPAVQLAEPPTVDQRRAADEPLDQLRALGAQRRPATIDGAEPRVEAAVQGADKDAAADSAAKAAREPAERAQQAGGDVVGVGAGEVQQVGERVVDGGAGEDAVGEEERHIQASGDGRVRAQREGEHGHCEERDANQARRVEAAGAPDVDPADQDPAQPEAEVRGDEHAAAGAGREAEDGERRDGRVEEDRPARRHEAQLRQAGEQGTPILEHGDRDDGVGRHKVLNQDKQYQRPCRDSKRNDLDLG